MPNKEYWAVIVEEAMPEMGISIPDDKKIELIEALAYHASMEWEATGLSVAQSNLTARHEKELKDTQKLLQEEREKIICRTCEGTGSLTTYGGTFMCTSRCYECNGDGRVHPSKASKSTLGIY